MEQRPNDALTMLDQWGGRKFIIPAPVTGFFRRWRTRTQIVLLLIFLGLPWTKVNGIQSFLLDIPDRRFVIFGKVFLAHDAPLIFFILFFLTILLALATAIWGRVWCGWACPQTVFIDGVYRRIEEWIEGNYIQRRKMRQEPLTGMGLLKVSFKWLAYVLVSSVFAHSFIAYFVGAERLLGMAKGAPGDNWIYFLIVSSTTALLTFNFGWFREQFCIIMCPYGRLQSVLMDSQSVTVIYNVARGEPRKGLALEGQKSGDCVSCNRCVQVCPTAIDIRQGTQLECIACTACIDACNEIMTKVKKPQNLIQYQNMNGTGVKWKRPRVLVYMALLVFSSVGLSAGFFHRADYSLVLLRATDTPYQVLQGQQVMNHFKIHFHNQTGRKQHFKLSLPPEWSERGVKLTTSEPEYEVAADQDRLVHFFTVFPQSLLTEGRLSVELSIQESASAKIEIRTMELVGP